MNQESEASSSSQPPPESDKAKHIEALLKECKGLRKQAESVKNAHTITFYSRLVFTAYEAIKTIINKFKTTYPTLVEDDVKACEYYWEITCNLSKEIRAMFVDAVTIRSPASNRGGDSRKVSMWKKQCDKNMEKIESLIRNTILLGDESTWFDEFWLFGIFHGGVSGVLVILHKLLIMKESEDDDEFENITERAFERFEMCYKGLISDMLEMVRKGVKDQQDLPEESSLNNSEEKEDDALKKSQEDDIVKRFQEAATVTQINLQEAEIAEEISNKLQEEEEEEEALKELHEEEALKEQKIVEETMKKLQKGEEMKNLPEEEALKNLHGDDTQKKQQEEDTLTELQVEQKMKELQEEEALKKSQEEETQKNSQETKVNMKVQEVEEEELKKSQEEKNSGDGILKFGDLTFKMKNGVMERILE